MVSDDTMASRSELNELRKIPHRELGIYSVEMTPEEAYSAGRNAGYTSLTIAHQLNLEATREKHKHLYYRGESYAERFKRMANFAFKMHAEGRGVK